MDKNVLRQLTLWLAGQVLPEEDVLQDHLDKAREGMAFALIGGVLLSAVLIVLHLLLYYAFIQQGMLPLLAATLTIVLALLLCIYCFCKARNRFNNVRSIKQDLDTHPESLLDQREIHAFVDAFKEGFRRSDKDS